MTYLKATFDACATVWHRIVAVVKGLCWFSLLCLSLTVHVPIAVFDLLEFVTLGSTGLAIVLMVANLLSYLAGGVNWVTYSTGVILAAGVVTHGWRFGDERGRLQNTASGAVVSCALHSVRLKVAECNRREETCLSSLRCPESSTRARLRFRRNYPTEGSSGTTLSSGGSPKSAKPVLSTPATVPYSTTTNAAAPIPSTTPSDTSTSVNGGYFALSDEEIRVVKCLRDMERDRVGRGRPTLGRGVCPVPGNIACEPASGAHHVPEPCPTSTFLSGQMA
ncbi:hypothetical protein PHMEG_0008345 [Phytophthora megakarya]|uniref:Transmembrane protein n=1 Tax=Phytophthora megakarya TaxID=4795 RepID=A0A225WL29_9STRA|nr:hypothetical protein PHMEG_0008345 [Phytophthora megakarya]